jgi:plasmid maintenance system antidote protein VapI
MTTAAILFDALIAKFGLRNDADLAYSLEVDPCNVSRLRAGRRQIGHELVLRIHDVFGLAVADIKAALGMKALPLAECLAEPRAG